MLFTLSIPDSIEIAKITVSVVFLASYVQCVCVVLSYYINMNGNILW